MSSKTENYSLSTKQQLDLLLDSDGESQMNSKYRSKYFGGVSETKLTWTTCPETHWTLRMMRPKDKTKTDSNSVQSFAIVKKKKKKKTDPGIIFYFCYNWMSRPGRESDVRVPAFAFSGRLFLN